MIDEIFPTMMTPGASGNEKTENGLDWHAKTNEDGTQIWVTSLNGEIQNGGINNQPIDWNEETGFNYNPKTGENKK